MGAVDNSGSVIALQIVNEQIACKYLNPDNLIIIEVNIVEQIDPETGNQLDPYMTTNRRIVKLPDELTKNEPHRGNFP